MEVADLKTRLLDDARSYDPSNNARTLLGPHRDALLLYRVKDLSYEQIAATLLRHGLKVSAAAVGLFCRKNFTKAEVLRERRRLEADVRKNTLPPPARPGATADRTQSAPASNGLARRGPKIARDDF